jgi:hypothetical protein
MKSEVFTQELSINSILHNSTDNMNFSKWVFDVKWNLTIPLQLKKNL